jgi:hypothetical protein
LFFKNYLAFYYNRARQAGSIFIAVLGHGFVGELPWRRTSNKKPEVSFESWLPRNCPLYRV